MKKCALIFISSVLLLACARRPAENELPKSEGNSVDHSHHVSASIESSANAAGSPFGAQFLDTLIADHEAVIDVAQLAQTRSGNPELKELVRGMIAKFQTELKQLHRLRDIDFASSPPSVNTEMPGIKEGVLSLDPDKLDLLKEQLFDKEFLVEMIRHHEGSIKLLADAEQKLNSPDASDDLQGFIRTSLAERHSELDQMKKWQNSLAK